MKLSDDVVIVGSRAYCKSYAKINLTLDVLGKRDDGYHEVEMIMQTIGLFDMITVDKTADSIKLTSNLAYLPTNDKNIAYKAADLFFKTSKISGGAKIAIQKNIPVAAGLGGGSGNGGAVLCGLNMLYGKPFSDEELLKLGALLGADVPFCMEGGTCICRGIGEVMSSVCSMKPFTVLLVKPPVSVSTPEIYNRLDSEIIQTRPDTAAMISAIENNDIYSVSKKLSNVMEAVTVKMHPVISGIRTKMIMNGAIGARMSGSGPTVFGIFDDDKKAIASAESFYKQFRDVYICKTIN